MATSGNFFHMEFLLRQKTGNGKHDKRQPDKSKGQKLHMRKRFLEKGNAHDQRHRRRQVLEKADHCQGNASCPLCKANERDCRHNACAN